jgi:hypothetical protein
MAPPFLTPVLDGGEWWVSHQSRFNPRGKSLKYLLDMRLKGPQRQPLAPAWNRALAIQPLASLYIYWAKTEAAVAKFKILSRVKWLDTEFGFVSGFIKLLQIITVRNNKWFVDLRT